MANRCAAPKIFAAVLLSLLSATFTAGQLSQLPMPQMSEVALLADIFHATQQLQERCRAMEFKERVSFRLAGIFPEGRASRNVDFRQSADYAVTVRGGKMIERKFLQSTNNRHFGMDTLLKGIDIPTIQETMPPVATLQTGLLNFVSSEYVNGYKELGHEKIKKHHVIKMALRFRPGRMPIDECYLWIDEQTHSPVRAELKIGSIGRFENVSLLISYEDGGQNELPASIHQEMACSTYDQGIPLRLEHTSVYSELKPISSEP